MRVPTAVDPVKLTQSTSGDSVNTAAGSGLELVTMLTTPGGKPTSSKMRANSINMSGSWGAGFMTTVLPAASAGATLPAMLTSGKLYDAMHATTPTGWRRTTPPIRPPGASGVVATGLGASGIEMSLVARLAYSRN